MPGNSNYIYKSIYITRTCKYIAIWISIFAFVSNMDTKLMYLNLVLRAGTFHGISPPYYFANQWSKCSQFTQDVGNCREHLSGNSLRRIYLCKGPKRVSRGRVAKDPSEAIHNAQ